MSAVAIQINNKPLLTPSKQPLTVPAQALADAIIAEWKTHKKFGAAHMPLTALAYTAIDQIAGRESETIEALLIYIDTDTLCYRTESKLLHKRQQEEWDPVLEWAKEKFGAAWQTTTGILPLEQSPVLHKSISTYLHTLDAMQLAACSVLSSLFSSLVLALAVTEGHLGAEKAFQLSRLEEEAQAEQWGRDEAAQSRQKRMATEVVAAEHFLRLLEPA